ncbi:MAG: hypothetical protein GIKADHBN_00045 [Phycisphaerales bacterium]|nr:hypothetical protein [Phycisphaerales bacterium]
MQTGRVSLVAAIVGAGVLAVSSQAGFMVPPPPGAARPNAPAAGAARKFVERPGDIEFSGQLIVRPLQSLDAARSEQARELVAPHVREYFAEVDEYVLNVPGAADAARGEAENAMCSQLMATGLFEYAEPNWICYPLNTPNDPLFTSQWHHQNMQSELGWNVATGSSDTIIAFCDTGIELTHPDLAPKRVLGYDAYNNIEEASGGSVDDINGHGTHVAGCGAAFGNNAAGVAGVNWNARIMMVRIAIDSGGGAYVSDMNEGARWAIDHGAKSVSVSYGGVDSSSLNTTGSYIRSKGCLYLFAAGNDSRDLSGYDWQNVIVVGASNAADQRAGFSAYGRAVDLFAPGESILSSVMGNGYNYASGTSMATPVANGVVSLIYSINPNLTAAQAETILFNACDDMGDPGNDLVYGWGRANVYKAALAAAATLGPQPPIAINDTVPTAVFGEPRTVDVLANDFDVNSDPLSITAFDATTVQGGTVLLAAGAGPGGRDVLHYLAPSGYTGPDSFTYTISDGVTGTDIATVSLTVMSESLFRNPDPSAGAGPGVLVSYYALSNPQTLPPFSGLTPYATDVLSDVNFPSTDGVFITSGRADGVGATFDGFVHVPATDEYTFYTESDDGSRLRIGNTVVVNNNGLHGMIEKSGKIKLKKGTHIIRVEFFENGGGAGLIARIASSGIPKQAIPASMWLRSCGADFDQSGFVDLDDYSAFVAAFEAGEGNADFDRSGFVDLDDFHSFVKEFEEGC